MRFYQTAKQYYCGIDLHARKLYICIIDQAKQVLVHRPLNNRDTDLLLALLAPYRDNIVVACESTYAWYWLADFCAAHHIEFILGHALYMKAINGGKVKNDRIDAQKIALLVQAGLFPLAYVYPRHKRSLRDLLRRRLTFTRNRAKMLCHVHLMNTQGNRPSVGTISKSRKKRSALMGTLDNEANELSLSADLAMIDHYGSTISKMELYLLQHARINYTKELMILQSIRGIGDIIALTILFEVDDINRFATVQDFASYCRLVTCTHESAGKIHGVGGKKIGNEYLRYIFAEAAIYVVKFNPRIQTYFDRLQRKKGTAKAYSIVAHRIARAVYFMLKNKTVFDEHKFLGQAMNHELLTGAAT